MSEAERKIDTKENENGAGGDGLGNKLETLLATAEAAEERFDHETAVAHYTAALDLPDLTPHERYELLLGRSQTYWRWGYRIPAVEDSGDLLATAREMERDDLLAEALVLYSFRMSHGGITAPADELMQEALTLAQELEDARLIALAYLAHSSALMYSDLDAARVHVDKAVPAARRSDDVDVLFEALRQLSSVHSLNNDMEDAQQTAAEMRALAFQRGGVEQQMIALFNSAHMQTDLAQMRDYYEQALAGNRTVNNLRISHLIANNMSLLLTVMGLYGRALAHAFQARDFAILLGEKVDTANAMDGLARAYLGRGQLDEAEQTIRSALEILDSSVQGVESYLQLGLGQVALARGDMQQAIASFRSAKELWEPLTAVAEVGLAAAYLALDDPKKACEHTALAIAAPIVQDYPVQETWWRHYEALTAANDSGAFEALDQARQTMFAAIDSLSDEGLRRNYLNKVAVNRAITLTWAAQAAKREMAIDPFTAHEPPESNLREQFRRVVDIGARLSAQHDPDRAADFIVEEFVEMSGAERVLLLLLDSDGALQETASFNPEGALDLAHPLLEMLRHNRQPLLRENVGEVPDDELPELHQRSLVALPLISQGEFLGFLYGDMRQIFGRFDESDAHLLGMLANQAASALENADLVSNLEDKVDARTADLEERNNELAIINSVQDGLAAELDLEAIFEIVGEKIGAIYPQGGVWLGTYDADQNLIVPQYGLEGGRRLSLPPQQPGALFRHLIDSREPLLMRTRAAYRAMGSTTVEGTDTVLSGAYVPLTVGDRFVGHVMVESIEQENAYDESDLRLLTTLGSSMSAALENARLFDETQSLLAQTEQRNAELAVINAVQDGLVAEMDITAIYKLVGDKLVEIFDADATTIFLIDQENNLSHLAYGVQQGQVAQPQTFPLDSGGLTLRIVQSAKPLMLGTDAEAQALGSQTVAVDPEDPDEEMTKSYLGAPLLAGGKVIAVAAVHSFKEHAYDEAALRLLTTITNSMSVALSNARLFDETQHLLTETESRNAELAVINTVQEGLVAEMDMQAIYNLVGDKIQEVTGAGVVMIVSIDHNTNLMDERYAFEEGQRQETVPPSPIREGSASEKAILTKQPLLLSSRQEMEAFAGSDTVVPGTQRPKSVMWVPIIAGDEVKELVSIQDLDKEFAFDQADVRLLTTLANSMSVALENARLFNETQRLLTETESRNAELAVINAVQQGLVAEMDIQAIYELVGDQISEIFDAHTILISAIDPHTNLTDIHYLCERDERYYPEPRPMEESALLRHMVANPAPIKFDTPDEAEKIGLERVPGTEDIQSGLAVPFIQSGTLRGIISLQNLDLEHAFSDADLRLLTTITNSLGLALENARLYDESQSLLAETEQRAAELAIINTVQQGLVAELDLHAIYDLVGDKLVDIFNADVTEIGLFDSGKQLIDWPYAVERGERYESDPVPLGKGLTSIVIESRQPLVVRSLQEGVALGAILIDTVDEDEERVESYLGVPLMVGDEVIGIATLQSYEQNAYDESAVRLFTTITNSMNMALENARLFQQTQELLAETGQRAAELAIINTVQSGLASELEMQAIYDLVGDKIVEIFGADATDIGLIDRDANRVNWVYGSEGGKPAKNPPLPLGRGITTIVIESRKPLVSGSQQESRELGAFFTGGDEDLTQSYLGVPLIVGDEVIGVAAIHSNRRNAYDESAVRLFTTITGSMNLALENARLFEETQHLLAETGQRAAELALINSVQSGLAAQLDMQSIIDLVGDKIVEIFDAQVVTVNRFHHDQQLNEYVYSYENGENQQIGSRPILPWFQGLIKDGQPQMYNSGLDELRARGEVETVDGDATQASIVAPLKRGDLVTGYISVQNTEHENAFEEADLRLLTTLAGSLSVALENARLFDETQSLLAETGQRAAELALINSVQSGLAAQLDMQSIINLVGDRIVEIFDAQVVTINRFHHDQGLNEYTYSFEDGLRNEEVLLAPIIGFAEKLIRDGAPQIVNSGTDAMRARGEIATVDGKDVLSFINAPLKRGDLVTGYVSVQNIEHENAFDEGDLRLITTLASSLSVALESARLFDETQRHAREMSALTEVGSDISATLDLSDVLERIAGHALELLDVSDSALFLPDETGGVMRGFVAQGSIAEQVLATTVQPGAGILGSIWQSREAELLNDADNDPRAVTIAGTEKHPDERMMVTPLLSGDDVVGLMAVWRQGDAFAQEDLRFLNGLARQAAIAIQNARLFSSAEAAQADAERANDAKSTFLANMSHELRTPLNAIIGFTRIVQRKARGQLPEKQVDNLGKVLSSGEHLLNLINTILDIAKIEAGRMDLSPSKFQAAPLIEASASTTQPLLKPGVEMIAEIDPDLPLIHSDQDKLKQILLNLLSNAAKFTHEGTVLVRAHSDGDMLTVDVTDTGIGISEEALGRVFEEFQQADSSTTRQYGGTGLGLPISKHLAQLLGGDLSVASVVGEGSTFTVQILVEIEQSTANEQQSTVNDQQLTEDEAGVVDSSQLTVPSSQLILSIDDSADALELLRENLNEAGFQMVGARTGAEGLEKARELRPAAITLDIILPDMDGWQVLHGLKTGPDTRDIPVILLTVVDKRALGMQLGAADYLVKPLDHEALLASLDRYLPGDDVRSLLVVDDDEGVRDMVSQLLENEPYDVRTAVDGMDALELVKQAAPDAILLDLLMPRLDGFGVLAKLREDASTAAIPVIVLTAKTLTGEETAVLQSSAQQVIQKQGLAAEDLVTELKHVLNNN